MERKGQTAIEYLFIVGGAIMFVVLVVIIIRSGVLSSGTRDVEEKSGDYLQVYGKPYLFFDNFDSDSASDQKWDNKTVHVWSAADGYYSVSTAEAGSALAITRNSFSNFVAEVKFKADNFAGTGIRFRTNNAGIGGYVLQFEATQISLSGPSAPPAPIPFSPSANTLYTFSIEAIGDQITVYRDGTQIFSITDSTYSSGRIGIYSLPSDDGKFDHVRVWPAD